MLINCSTPDSALVRSVVTTWRAKGAADHFDTVGILNIKAMRFLKILTGINEDAAGTCTELFFFEIIKVDGILSKLGPFFNPC